MAKKRGKFSLNGDDAYFMFLRHELNQVQKQVGASHAEIDLDTLAPTQRRKTEVPDDVTTATGAMPPDQWTIFDLAEGDS